ERLAMGGWFHPRAWFAVAPRAPLVGAAAMPSDIATPSFPWALGRRPDRRNQPLAFALVLLLVALTALALQAALGLVFDPRYRDFPVAPFTGAAIPFLVMTGWPRRKDLRLSAETFAAATLVRAAIYIGLNERPANWQAMWFCATAFALAITLLPARGAPG